jgi:hypothetical protein
MMAAMKRRSDARPALVDPTASRAASGRLMPVEMPRSHASGLRA